MTDKAVEPVRESARHGAGLWIGLSLTVLVLGLMAAWLWMKAGGGLAMEAGQLPSGIMAVLLSQRIGEIGQLVSGIAGALAFIWIIVAYHQQSGQLRLQREELGLQRHELALQRRELERLADESKGQLEVLKQTSATARREGFIRLLELYERKLSLDASHISSMTATDPVLAENHHNAWRAYESGDRNALFRNLLVQLGGGQHRSFLQRVDQIADGRAYLESFSGTVAEVMQEAASVDEKMLTFCRSCEWAFLAEALDKARTTLSPAT